MEKTLRAIPHRFGARYRRRAKTSQYAALLLGGEADDILTSTNITDEGKKKYATVVKIFYAFFQVRENVIFERARFNHWNQLNGESVELYITMLYRLMDSCEYGTLKEEMLRDNCGRH